jgi:hypothetical protein
LKAGAAGFLTLIQWADRPDLYGDPSRLGDTIAGLRRAESTGWTLYEIGGKPDEPLPQYIQLSSIQQFEGRAAAKVKYLAVPSLPKVIAGKELPDAAYLEDLKCL